MPVEDDKRRAAQTRRRLRKITSPQPVRVGVTVRNTLSDSNEDEKNLRVHAFLLGKVTQKLQMNRIVNGRF